MNSGNFSGVWIYFNRIKEHRFKIKRFTSICQRAQIFLHKSFYYQFTSTCQRVPEGGWVGRPRTRPACCRPCRTWRWASVWPAPPPPPPPLRPRPPSAPRCGRRSPSLSGPPWEKWPCRADTRRRRSPPRRVFRGLRCWSRCGTPEKKIKY